MLRKIKRCLLCGEQMKDGVCPACGEISKEKRDTMRELGAMQVLYAPPDVLRGRSEPEEVDSRYAELFTMIRKDSRSKADERKKEIKPKNEKEEK